MKNRPIRYTKEVYDQVLNHLRKKYKKHHEK